MLTTIVAEWRLPCGSKSTDLLFSNNTNHTPSSSTDTIRSKDDSCKPCCSGRGRRCSVLLQAFGYFLPILTPLPWCCFPGRDCCLRGVPQLNISLVFLGYQRPSSSQGMLSMSYSLPKRRMLTLRRTRRSSWETWYRSLLNHGASLWHDGRRLYQPPRVASTGSSWVHSTTSYLRALKL